MSLSNNFFFQELLALEENNDISSINSTNKKYFHRTPTLYIMLYLQLQSVTKIMRKTAI